MHILYIYPFAQAPDYDRPTTPIRAYMVNDALDAIVDKEECPYSVEDVLEPLLEKLSERHGFKRTWNNCHIAKSFGEGLTHLRSCKEVDASLTSERQLELLALLEKPKKYKPLTEKEKRELIGVLNKAKAEEMDEAARLNKEFKDQL